MPCTKIVAFKYRPDDDLTDEQKYYAGKCRAGVHFTSSSKIEIDRQTAQIKPIKSYAVCAVGASETVECVKHVGWG